MLRMPCNPNRLVENGYIVVLRLRLHTNPGVRWVGACPVSGCLLVAVIEPSVVKDGFSDGTRKS